MFALLTSGYLTIIIYVERLRIGRILGLGEHPVVEPYDPLSYDNLAQSVVGALMAQTPQRLPPSEPFEGSGVYAIYYLGGFRAYNPIALRDCTHPIYVGKAIPTGARKGSDAGAPPGGSPLYRRLREHAESITQARNLALDDFRCRYLVVVPVWITLAERFLVSHYRPVWNVTVDGFGNHDPGRGRRNMRRPLWDIIHPGRPWAAKLRAAHTAQDVLATVEEFLKS